MINCKQFIYIIKIKSQLPLISIHVSNHKNLKYIKGENLPKIVIIAGPNGVGKSTLLDCIWREENCNLTKSENLKTAYISLFI